MLLSLFFLMMGAAFITLGFLTSDHRVVILGTVLLLAGLVILTHQTIRLKKLKPKKKNNTTAFMNNFMVQQGAADMQLAMHASAYGLQDTMHLIKVSQQEISNQKEDILLLMENLKLAAASPGVKPPEEIKQLVALIKSKIVLLEESTAQFCSPENIQHFEAAVQNFNPERRVLPGSKRGPVEEAILAGLVLSTAKDKQVFLNLLNQIKRLPQEIKQFVSLIVTVLKQLEDKFIKSFGGLHFMQGDFEKLFAHKEQANKIHPAANINHPSLKQAPIPMTKEHLTFKEPAKNITESSKIPPEPKPELHLTPRKK